MGIGFVLLGLAGAGLIGAAIAAAVLVAIVSARRKRVPALRRRWLVVAAGLPFVLLAYAGVAFIGYWAWCEEVRGVDPGLGDDWHVRLPNGWAFGMVDLSEQNFLTSRSGQQLESGAKRLGLKGSTIFGQDDTGYFLIDTASEAQTHVADEAEFRRRIATLGASARDLLPPGAFYDSQRGRSADLLAATIIAILPLLLVGVLVGRFVAATRAAPRDVYDEAYD